MLAAIEIFKVLDKKKDDLPCHLFASKKVLEAVSIKSPENKANLEPILDCLERGLENIDDNQACIKFSCFFPTNNGLKLVMLIALFIENQDALVILMDEEMEQGDVQGEYFVWS